MDNDLKIFERFAKYVEVTDTCWLWLGARINRDSRPQKAYGQFRIHGSKRILAHVYAYELFVRQKSYLEELDHLCRNSQCVNPLHLEPVTHQTNLLRGNITGPKFRLHPTHPALHLGEINNEVRIALHKEACESGISTSRLACKILSDYVNRNNAVMESAR